MAVNSLPFSIGILLALAAPGPGSSISVEQESADEKLLLAAGVETDGRGLIAFFRSRSLLDEDLVRLESLLDGLGAPNYKARAAASARLVEVGSAALPALRIRVKHVDPEIARRAEACISEIEHQPRGAIAVIMAATRLVARRNPPGAIRALLTFLPFNEDEWVEEEILTGLTELSRKNPTLDPFVLELIRDKSPSRRAASALLAGRSREPAYQRHARRLLEDVNPRVRLRAAQGLLSSREKAAVPALIALVGGGPLPLANRAEDLLFRLAGERAPSLPASSTPTSQRHNEKIWQQWWSTHAESVDLARWDEGNRNSGFTLLTEMDSNQVWESGPGGQVRWRLDGLLGPMDAQALPGGKVLVAEYEGRRITERDLKGKVLWSIAVPGNPIACQRLSNGNTFFASHHVVTELTAGGREVFSYNAQGHGRFLFGAQKLPTGNIIYIANPGFIEEVDPVKGQVLRTIQLGEDFGGWCSVEVLPTGRFLVALFTSGKVRELDAAGKTLWECSISGACHATRLPNGNTLVASMHHRKVVEVDPAGKTIRETSTEGRPWRVHYR